MNDRTERAVQLAPPTTNPLTRALRAIRLFQLDWGTEISLTAALIAGYNKWLSDQSYCDATQIVALTTSTLCKALRAIGNSGLDRRTQMSLTAALIAGHHKWLLQQSIDEAGSRCGSK